MKLKGKRQPSMETQLWTHTDGDDLLSRFLEYHSQLLQENSARARIVTWLLAYPGRKANHAEIAWEVGLSREAVTRDLDTAWKETRLEEPLEGVSQPPRMILPSNPYKWWKSEP